MKRIILFSVALALFALCAHAKPVQRDTPPQLQPSSGPGVAPPATTASSAVDTTYLLGGPARWDGSFETPGGLPDWHGWTHEDYSTNSGIHWHVSTYMADLIPGKGPGNQAMYCGDETLAACDPPDTIGGYGNNWHDDLEWRQTIANLAQPVTVRLTGTMNYQTEPAYDFIYLVIQRGSNDEVLASWEGLGTADLDFTTVLDPGEFSGPDGNEVRLVLRFRSDQSFSDDDCLFPSSGACQIDDLSVYLDNNLISFDDFEPGNPVNWEPVPAGVGDFANLRNDLGDIDPCLDNNTWQVNFVDDGLVVPGTGGTTCINWCYDPGGWTVNNDGGLLSGDIVEWHLKNQILSPPIPWIPGNDGAELSFGVYQHAPLTSIDDVGMFHRWHVRSTSSADPADLEFATWRSDSLIYHGGPQYKRHDEPISEFLEPDRQWVQIALGVEEWGWIFGSIGHDGTPAPYFDNVSLKVWDPHGPEVKVEGRHLFRDAFPEAGILNPQDLAANWCRVDVQASVGQGGGVYIPGDSLVAVVKPLRPGATVTQPPSLHWVMACNPTFDSVRPSAPSAQGLLRGMVSGDPAEDQSGIPAPDTWSFDLPDTGFFFPGDRLHYYITGTDDLAGDIRTSVWPPDTTGVLDFTVGSMFPGATTVTALPTLTQPAAGQFSHPDVLFCGNTEDPEATQTWFDALHELGLVPRVNVDVMTVKKAGSDVGFASLAPLDILAGFRTFIISTELVGRVPPNDDPNLVSDWLATGNKQLLLAEDNISSKLNRQGSGQTLLSQLGLQFHTWDVSLLNGGVRDLQISPVLDNGILPNDTTWQVYAGCPENRQIDAVSSQGSGQASATLDAAGMAGGAYAALVTVDDQVLGNRTAVMPFDLDAVTGMTFGSGKNGAALSPQASLLNYLLVWLGTDLVSGVEDLPGLGQISVTAHPNPFNPSTTIAFELPRTMEVSLDIYDLQGRLVRRLLDESPYIQGSHKQMWDGRNAHGQTTASGVYFYRFEAGDQKRVGKLTLLK